MINNEYTICPKCGKPLIYIADGYKMNICTNSACRLCIKDDVIGNVELRDYSLIQQNYNLNNKSSVSNKGFYMLLKENLSGPMIIKNTNSALENKRNSLCILRAGSKDDAIKQFREKFKYIKINDEMIVQIKIQEV